jgi:hypothetical protein
MPNPILVTGAVGKPEQTASLWRKIQELVFVPKRRKGKKELVGAGTGFTDIIFTRDNFQPISPLLGAGSSGFYWIPCPFSGSQELPNRLMQAQATLVETAASFKRGRKCEYRMAMAEGRTPPLSCPRPTDRAYQKRTKYRQIYRYLPFLTLSNLFRVNSRWVDSDRVKVAL